MGSDWLHCNVCLFTPNSQNCRKFFLSNCGHLICGQCASPAAGPLDKCPACKAGPLQMREINRNLPSDIQRLFKDPLQILQESAKQISEAINFQTKQSDYLLKAQLAKLRQASQLMQAYDEIAKQRKAMESEIDEMKETEKLLKVKLDQKRQAQRYANPHGQSNSYPHGQSNSYAHGLRFSPGGYSGLNATSPAGNPLAWNRLSPLNKLQQARTSKNRLENTPRNGGDFRLTETPGSSRSGGMQSIIRRRSSPETISDLPRKITKQSAEPPVKLAFALNPNTLPRL